MLSWKTSMLLYWCIYLSFKSICLFRSQTFIEKLDMCAVEDRNLQWFKICLSLENKSTHQTY